MLEKKDNNIIRSNLQDRISKNKEVEDFNLICPFPKSMLLEPTNACNDSCLFCANSKCTKSRGIINKELAIKILEQAYEGGTREVGFYGTGEPLLDKNLECYISYAKQLGYEYVYITTNGALLSEERAQAIVEAGIDSIKFSINASNAKDYWLIHGKDEFDKVIENIIYLDTLRKRETKKFNLYISYVITRYTDCNQDNFKKKYQQYVDDIVFYDCVNISGCMTNEIKDYMSVNQSTGYHPENDICPMIFKSLYVTCEGYLTMCCADFQNYLAIADLNKENLQDAWNNQFACALRKRHLEHNLEGTLCFNCIHNCNEVIEPLNSDLAVYYDSKIWNKGNEISKRINQWSSQ